MFHNPETPPRQLELRIEASLQHGVFYAATDPPLARVVEAYLEV